MPLRRTIAVILFFSCTEIFSQSVQRSTVFSSAGNYSDLGTLKLQSNIGELMVDTYNNSQNIFAQGFIQPETFISTIIEQTPDALGDGKVYPNPVNDKLYIQLTLVNKFDVKIEVYDVLGKLQMIDISNSDKNYELDVEQLNPGIYFIKISSSDNQFGKIFKINKV